jgi:hypothetical protein
MVNETEQPYAYTGDDPVNGNDPSGDLGCGFLWLSNCPSKTPVPTMNCVSSGGLLQAGYSPNSINCDSGPLIAGSAGSSSSGSGLLGPGSTVAEAQAAAEASGYQIPSGYIAVRADNGQGWVFRAPGSEGNANIVRVGEPNSQNPTGYVRYYNSDGQPLNAEGNPGPDSETHLPLRGGGGDEESPIDPLEISFTTSCSGVDV